MSGGIHDVSTGRVIQGRWRLKEKLGEGGMGAVYLAEQLSIRGRLVAIKLLREELAGNPEYAARFRSEAERAAAVDDPRIVTVFDFGQTEDGYLFMAMEYVVGDTLGAILRNGPLPIERSLSLGLQLADALRRVHDAGIIHRDVKPANVMIRTNSDDLKLMDFGIARAANDAERTFFTQGGIIPGTPAYMAPEQIQDGISSIQTDIYAWGLVMYAMLAGRKPFEAQSASAIQYLHVHEPPPPLERFRPMIPPALSAIVLKALEKSPRNRQQGMREVAAALRRVSAERPHREEVSIGDAPTVEAANRLLPKRRRLQGGYGVALLAVIVTAAIFGYHFIVQRNGEPVRVDISTGSAATASGAKGKTEAISPVQDQVKIQDALKLATFFSDRGDYQNAIAELERAISVAPDNRELLAALSSARKAKSIEENILGKAR